MKAIIKPKIPTVSKDKAIPEEEITKTLEVRIFLINFAFKDMEVFMSKSTEKMILKKSHVSLSILRHCGSSKYRCEVFIYTLFTIQWKIFVKEKPNDFRYIVCVKPFTYIKELTIDNIVAIIQGLSIYTFELICLRIDGV